jgi:Ca2+/Na+ antiporter
VLERAMLRFWQVITFGRLPRLRPIEAVLFLVAYAALLLCGFALAAAAVDWVLP